MKEYNKFIEKFSKKTRNELEVILKSNMYTDDAKFAAKVIIKNKSYRIIVAHPINIENEKSIKHKILFDIKIFFKTLSYREFLSVTSSVLFLISLIFIRNFYSSYAFFESTYNITVNIIIFTSILISNHIFFKLEHKISNSFIGRLIIDLSFVFFI